MRKHTDWSYTTSILPIIYHTSLIHRRFTHNERLSWARWAGSHVLRAGPQSDHVTGFQCKRNARKATDASSKIGQRNIVRKQRKHRPIT